MSTLKEKIENGEPVKSLKGFVRIDKDDDWFIPFKIEGLKFGSSSCETLLVGIIPGGVGNKIEVNLCQFYLTKKEVKDLLEAEACREEAQQTVDEILRQEMHTKRRDLFNTWLKEVCDPEVREEIQCEIKSTNKSEKQLSSHMVDNLTVAAVESHYGLENLRIPYRRNR